MGFSSLMVSLAAPVAKRALTALGIGVITYGAVLASFNAAKDQVVGLLGQMSTSVIWMADRAGLLAAFGIVLGAMAAKVGLQAVKKLGMIQA